MMLTKLQITLIRRARTQVTKCENNIRSYSHAIPKNEENEKKIEAQILYWQSKLKEEKVKLNKLLDGSTKDKV